MVVRMDQNKDDDDADDGMTESEVAELLDIVDEEDEWNLVEMLTMTMSLFSMMTKSLLVLASLSLAQHS